MKQLQMYFNQEYSIATSYQLIDSKFSHSRSHSIDILPIIKQYKIRGPIIKYNPSQKLQVIPNVGSSPNNNDQINLSEDSKQKETSSSYNQSYISQQSIKEPENYYTIRMQEVNFTKYTEQFQVSALQLEALYFQLLNFDFARTPPLQLAPYVSYYLFQLIQFRNDIMKISSQNYNMIDYDTNMFKVKKELQKNLIFQEKFKQQCQTQISFYTDIQEFRQNYKDLIFEYLDSTIEGKQFDYEVLLKDYFNYSELAESKMQIILDSLQSDYIHRKNNIAIGNVRFLFSTSQFTEIDYVFPIGKFEDLQFYDVENFIQENFKQVKNLDDPILQFFRQYSEQHSERAMILWFLVDVQERQTIYQQLREKLKNCQLDSAILKAIYFEITTEKRVCDHCVSMFSKIPVKYILYKLQDFTEIEIDSKFQFIILSQYFDDPQLEKNQGQNQKSRIWEYQKYNQKENQTVLQQDIQFNSQDYLLCYQEQEPTGLVSILFLNKRYSLGVQSNQDFKIEIDKVVLTNTFFLSIESSEKISINSTQSEPVNSKNHIQNFIEQKHHNQSKQKTFKTKKHSNRLLHQMVKLDQQFKNLNKSRLQIGLQQKFQQQQFLQESKSYFNIPILSLELIQLQLNFEFISKLFIHMKSKFDQMNFQLFKPKSILQFFWQVNYPKLQYQEFELFLSKIQVAFNQQNIIESEIFNKRLFFTDFVFLTSTITQDKILSIRKGKHMKNKKINYSLIKVYGKQFNDEYVQISFADDQVEDCISLIKTTKKELAKYSQQFKKIILLIISLGPIKNGCKSFLQNNLKEINDCLEILYINSQFQISMDDWDEEEDNQPEKMQLPWEEVKLNLFDPKYFFQRYCIENKKIFNSFQDTIQYDQQALLNFECQNHNVEENFQKRNQGQE